MSLILHPHVERIAVDDLKPYAKNARTHSKAQVRQIANSITRFGFTNPILIDDRRGIIAGHGRVQGHAYSVSAMFLASRSPISRKRTSEPIFSLTTNSL